MTLLLTALLRVHLACALGAVALFWLALLRERGGPAHRQAGRWFARAVYGAALTGGVLAVAGLFGPERLRLGAGLTDQAVTRQTLWLVLYLLVILVAPVQHGLAAVAAGPRPLSIRSAPHAALNLLAMAGAVVMLPAAAVWQRLTFLIVVPLGFAIGVRNLAYTARPHAAPADWQREHLTSQLFAGIVLHTALFVFGSARWLGLALEGWRELLPWVIPAAVGLPAIAWLRRHWQAR